MSDGAPVIPTALLQYNSYVVDPIWQRKFSIIWASAAALAILASAPHLLNSIKRGRAFKGFFGISERFGKGDYTPVVSEERLPESRSRRVPAVLQTLGSLRLWSLPGLELNLGQIIVILAYLVIVLVCIVVNAPLVDNPNRAGFLALAQLPVVFLFATKNSILSLLLGPGNGYEKLNYIHRWSGRCMFLGAVVHGSLWIRNHLQFGLPILGQQKETSGVAAFALLGVIVLSSLKPVRKYFYQAFFVIHVLAFVSFFVVICYHTIYASPWIFPPLAFYGADMLLRMFRYRIKDATLTPIDNQMTIIRIHDSDDGWVAGQHIRLRVFFSGRIFESHPLSILSAPPSISCLSNPDLILGARATGDWTRALNLHALKEKSRITDDKSVMEFGPQVQVMIDGPYGGCSIDLGNYESVLLVAGGSGATFTLGLLDDIVGRCIKLGRKGGERTRRIEFAWCVRSFASIEWFAPMLMDIATTASGTSLDLHISVFVTCICDPEAIPAIPNSDVTIVRPSINTLLNDMLTPSSCSRSSTRTNSVDIAEEAGEKSNQTSTNISNGLALGGGVAVCASGPETLTREAHNAVARLGLSRGVELGGVALHTELFAY